MARDFVLVFVAILLGAAAATPEWPNVGIGFLVAFIVIWSNFTRRP